MVATNITYFITSCHSPAEIKAFDRNGGLGELLHKRLEETGRFSKQKDVIYGFIRDNLSGHIHDALTNLFSEVCSLPDSSVISPNRLDVIDSSVFIFDDSVEGRALYEVVNDNPTNPIQFLVIHKVWQMEEIHLWLKPTFNGYDSVLNEQTKTA